MRNASNETEVAVAHEYRNYPLPYEPPPPKEDEPSLLARSLRRALRRERAPRRGLERS